MSRDLSHDLGAPFKGEYLDRYVRTRPGRPPAGVSLGRRERSDRGDRRQARGSTTACRTRSRSGSRATGSSTSRSSSTAATWQPTSIASFGSIGWCAASRRRVDVNDWQYLLDFNEGCPNVGYLLEFLHKLREATPTASIASCTSSSRRRATSQTNRRNVMHEAAKLRPIVADESSTDLETLLLAREMGYTGVALKACKGQTHALLDAAAAQKFGMFLCVQDLTCPGASLIHSAGTRGTRARQRRHRSQRTPVRAKGERDLGRTVPRAVHDSQRHDGNRSTDRTGTWGSQEHLRFGAPAAGRASGASRALVARGWGPAQLERSEPRRRLNPSPVETV